MEGSCPLSEPGYEKVIERVFKSGRGGEGVSAYGLKLNKSILAEFVTSGIEEPRAASGQRNRFGLIPEATCNALQSDDGSSSVKLAGLEQAMFYFRDFVSSAEYFLPYQFQVLI